MVIEMRPAMTRSAVGQEVKHGHRNVDQEGQLVSQIDHVIQLPGKSNGQDVLVRRTISIRLE